MARQQSNTELAGSLAATLTPALPKTREMSFRGAQNSGLFDVGALYAEAIDEVLRRTRSDVRLAPLTRAAQPTWPRAGGWSEPVVSFDFDAAVPIEFTNKVAARSSRGIGWFGVAVAWLATVTMGASIATTLPGHSLTRLRLPASVLPAPPSPPPAASPSNSPVAPVPVAAVANASPSSPGPTVVPLALVVAAPAVAALAVSAPLSPSPHVVTKRPARQTATPPLVHARTTLPAASPVASPVASPPSSPVVPHPAAPSRATPASPPAVSTAGMSLDELIRHEVQAESAKHRASSK